jgi:hypothetical protein
MVVDEILGVVKLLPVDNKVPPVESEYHFMVPLPAADSVTVPVPHLDALVTVGASCAADFSKLMGYIFFPITFKLKLATASFILNNNIQNIRKKRRFFILTNIN